MVKRQGLTLTELAVVILLVGLLALALSTLLLSGTRSQGEGALLQAQALMADLRNSLGKDLRSATNVGLTASSTTGFVVQVSASPNPLCVQYRLQAGRLQRASWTATNCGSGTNSGFQDLLAPALLPNAAFCYGDEGVYLMDAPCDSSTLNGKALTLRIGGRDYRFPPLVVTLRSG
ncbi:hypothetical protein TJA_22320 [Thermus sp. LT1-2-5]|uniref:prepilin-type N-terminal cleavage/methylation domain-containing protein n=1 Tax=Thermus sp. LT1-2-5 TaxID=3026935 RepID=UPI0030EA4278